MAAYISGYGVTGARGCGASVPASSVLLGAQLDVVSGRRCRGSLASIDWICWVVLTMAGGTGAVVGAACPPGLAGTAERARDGLGVQLGEELVPQSLAANQR